MTARRLPRFLFPVLAAVALVGGFAGYRWSPWRESPRQVWDTITAAAEAGDYGAVYDRFDPASRDRMAPDLRAFAAKAAPDRADDMTDRERFALMVARLPHVRAQFLPARVLEVRQDGDRARVVLDRPDPMDRSPLSPPTSGVGLVRRDGRWWLSHGADQPP